MEELKNDAQVPFRRIALKLGISPETVKKRHERMKKSGRIVQSCASVDFSKIGYEGIVFLMIASRERSEVSARLKEMRNVISVNRTIGDSDVLAIAVIQGITDLLNLVNEVEQLPDVRHVEIFLSTLSSPFPAGFVVQGLEYLFKVEKESNDPSTEPDVA